jgi:hypothetical protein
MDRLRISVAAAVLIAVAVAGCGVGEGESEEGTATLRVTRDHGSELMVEATTADPSESETVARFLDREADIETSYAGNFVEEINGVAGEVVDGRRLDWYFYVNGIWSPVGAAEAKVRAGDRIWWDYRDWTSAYRVPAVVGSYPEPFRSGFDGERWPTELICFPSGSSSGACDDVEGSLRDAGIQPEVRDSLGASSPNQNLRVLVGTWEEVRADTTAREMENGPAVSGVFARPRPCGGAGFALEAFDAAGEAAGGSSDAAWVATLQRDAERPTWVVSAGAEQRLAAAAAMLDEETLRDRYAVAAFDGGEPVAVPVAEDVGRGISCG